MAVELLANCSWATTFVEQLHGSLAVLKKLHKMYGETTLSLRAYLKQLESLFRAAGLARRS